MDQRKKNPNPKVVSLVPPPQKSVNYVPQEFLRPSPTVPEKKPSPAATVVVVTTPPDWKNPPNEKVPNEGLQHHFISRGSLINTESEAIAQEESFGEKYVDVVDTEVIKNEECAQTQSYHYLVLHLKRIYLIFTVLMLLDASFSALAMYSFDHEERTYAHQSLAYIFTNKKYIFSHLVALMFAIASFPLVGIAVIAYPKPKSKIILYGRPEFLSDFLVKHIFTILDTLSTPLRWGYFVIFELYLLLCLVVYSINTNGFYDVMKSNMKKDLNRPMDSESKFITLRDFSQGYYGCCGMYGYKDWTPERRNNSIDRGGYPVGCCDTSTPEECFPPLMETKTENGHKRTLIHKDGCLKYESRWTYSISIIYMLVLCCVIIATSAMPVYLYHVIAEANLYDIALVEIIS